MGPVGYWLDAQGNVASTDQQGNPQVTPSMQQIGHSGDISYDPSKDLYETQVNGKPSYQAPPAWVAAGNGNGFGKLTPQGGGLLHNKQVWDPSTGTYKSGGLDWGNIASLAVGGALTGGALSAAMAGGGAAAGAASAADAGIQGATDAAGAFGPLAGGYGAATTAATVPGALAGLTPAELAAAAGGAGGASGATISSMMGGSAPTATTGPLAGGYGLSTTLPDVPGALSSTTDLAAGAIPGGASVGSMGGLATPAATSGLTNAAPGSTIGNMLGSQGLANLGKIVGGASTGIQDNRLIQGNFAQKYDQNMLAAQTNRNATEADALKKLAQTSYLTNGHAGYTPPTIQLGGQQRTAPDLGAGFTAPSATQVQGAQNLQSQLAARLAPGGTYTPQPLSSYATPGPGETALNYLGPGINAAGTIMNMLGQ